MDKEKDKKNEEKLVRDSVFYGSSALMYVYKKSLNLAKALYIVTDIIKDKDPLKWSIRLEANRLVTLDFSNNDLKDNVTHLLVLVTSVKGLISLGQFSKNISQMNTTVLLEECDLILSTLSSLKTSDEGFILSSDFFNEEHKKDQSAFSETLSNDRIQGRETNLLKKEEKEYKGHQKDSLQVMSFKKNTEEKVSVFKGRRADDILSIIRDKGEVTIKDISNSIRDCSEKTIQRELISLLDKKIIKREGERRWSRYSII